MVRLLADRVALGALFRYPLRTAMMLLATAIGVAAVVVLTGLGEAARLYVTDEFRSLGTNLLIVLPGRTETTGAGAAINADAPVKQAMEMIAGGAGELCVMHAGQPVGVITSAHLMARLVQPRG